MKWNITFGQKNIKFSSDYAKAQFKERLKENPNRQYQLIENDKKSSSQLGLYFGGVLKAYCNWAENLDVKSPTDWDNTDKTFRANFNWELGTDVFTNEVKPFTLTLSELNKTKFNEYLKKVEQYFEDNQIPYPNPDLYKLWEDKYSMDYPDFFDWLEVKGLRCNGDVIELK